MTTPNDLPSVGTEDAPSMANYTFTIVADSGYESTTEGRCSAKQYGAVIYALHNDDSYADQRDKLASERDALAGRVAELEAERDALPLRPEEQRAVLADPGMLVRLIGYHDAQEAAGEAFAEGWGKYHERRALELLAIGRKVIAEDPGIWEPEIIAEFKPRFSERAALSATTPESKP